MRTTRMCGRKVALALLLGGAGALLAAPAAACEGEYRIETGDTLASIAARCDTSVAALQDANRVDPHRLQLGQTIRIPEIEGEDEPVAREVSRTAPDPAGTPAAANGYQVQPGDTPEKIARALGISLETLLAANEGLDPQRMQIGQVLNVPDDEEVQAILADREAERQRMQRWADEYPDPSISLSKGDWRLTVDVRGEGFAPGEMVEVAIAADGERWIGVGEMPADDDGRFSARARIPAEFADREEMRIALERPWGDRVVADYRHERTEPILSAVDETPSEIVVHTPPEVKGEPLDVAGEVEGAEDAAPR